MSQHIDSWIVAGYLVLIFGAGYLVSRRQKNKSADEFIGGGRTTSWWQTGLTLISMAVDPGCMSVAGLGFVWGFYVLQWSAVHIWFTAWFAAMFLVPIYWRSRILTTPEYLEKRFNVHCRAFFSVVMTVILVVTLTMSLYLGAMLLENLVGWPFWGSVAFISAVCGFYVILGGMRTVLTLDVYQAVFLLLTQAAVVIMSVKQAGGLAGLLAIKDLGDAGTPLPSLIPPSDWNLNTQTFFPLPAVVAWATVAGLSWLACNFGMAQRLLAARTERDAQKGLLLLGVLVTAVCFGAYAIGVSVRHLKPDLGPDQAFMHVMLTMFPAGVRGLLLAGMMAALLSTVDGLLTASSALFTEDIYRRFLRRAAGGNELKQVTRILEVLALLAAMSLLPTMRQSKSAMGFVQDFYGNVLGVVVALYLVGMFSKRATGRAAFISMITGIALAFFLNPPRNSAFLQAILPESLLNHPFQMNFAYVGFVTFVYGIVATLALSRLEPPIPLDKLTNLTIHTLPDVRGPWVGLKAWPNLWKWALLLAGGWFGFCVAWELIVRTR